MGKFRQIKKQKQTKKKYKENKYLVFSLLVLLVYPILISTASATITLTKTQCGLSDCYSTFTTSFNIPTQYIGNTYDLNNLPNSALNRKIGDIKNLKVSVIDKNTVNLTGNIEGASDNWWGFKLLNDNSFWDSTWWNSSWTKKANVTVTNDLLYGRTNATFTYNLDDNGFAKSDCSDIRVTDSNDVLYNNIYVYSTSTTCQIEIFDNFLGGQTKKYFIYYNNPTASAPTYYRTKYELIWRWNGTQQGIGDLVKVSDDGNKNMTAKTCDGTPCIAIFSITGSDTTLFNLSVYPNINGSNWGLTQYGHMDTKYNGSSASAFGTADFTLRMSPEGSNFYEYFSYQGNAGVCASGSFLRNRTTTTYNSPVNCSTFAVKKDWYTHEFYISSNNYTWGTYYNSSNTYENGYTWGKGTHAYQSMGLRVYVPFADGSENFYIKNLEFGSLIINRNLTLTVITDINLTSPVYSNWQTPSPPETAWNTNITWTDIDSGMFNGLIEHNFSLPSMKLNYSMANGSYGISIYNYSFNLLAEGGYCVKCYGNATSGRQNATSDLCFSYTTTSTSSTTTTPITSTVLLYDNISIVTDYFCNSDNTLLVKSVGVWNDTNGNYTYNYTASACEYNCTESIIGTRCNYSPSISFGISMTILIGIAIVVIIVLKLLSVIL